jgi:hypothetical protein
LAAAGLRLGATASEALMREFSEARVAAFFRREVAI